MNDWNYTKKGAKVGLIYGLTYSLCILLGSVLTPLMVTDTGGGIYEYNFLLDLILLLPLLPVVLLPHPGIFIIFEFPLAGAISGAILGFLVDIVKGSREAGIEKSQREKGVFIRIPFGSRKIVISEKLINCCIIAEFLILVFFVIMSSIGPITGKPGFTHEDQVDGVDGEYLKGGSSDYTINFNKYSGTFIESYPDGSKENGTYIANETVLTLYYSEGKTAVYNIYDAFSLVPINKNGFNSDIEWKKNWYVKPRLM